MKDLSCGVISRKVHDNSFYPWTREEELLVLLYYKIYRVKYGEHAKGCYKQLALIFNRSPAAIQIRMRTVIGIPKYEDYAV